MRRLYLLFPIITLLACITIPGSSSAIEQAEFKDELVITQAVSLTDISSDPEGNIYAADSEGKMAHVLDKAGRVKLSWGGKAGGFQMKEPSGIDVLGGNVYVADRGADQVHIFTKAGKYIESFGRGGDGPKEFSNPSGLCAARGAVYVADTGNKRIQVFSPDGIYMGSVGGKGVLDGPRDVSVDHRGYLFVADEGNIKVFTPSGKLEATYYTLKEPVAVRADKKGFYAADNATYQVRKFDFKGNSILSFGTEGKGKAQFRRISGIALGPGGEVYVTDTKKNTMQVFYAKQDFMMVDEAPYPSTLKWRKDVAARADSILWEPNSARLYVADKKSNSITAYEGSTPKVFQTDKKTGWKDPGGMAVDPEGFVWVADTGNDRVIKLNAEGKIIAVLGSSGSKNGYFSDPMDVAVSSTGNIYVADTGNERVQVFQKDGVFLRTLGDPDGNFGFEKPVAVALSIADDLYVVDSESNRVAVFDSEGRRKSYFGSEGEGKGQFNNPSDIFITMTEVYVLDSGNRRVQVFDLNNRYLREFGAEGNGKGDFSEPSSIALADTNRLFVSDTGTGRIQFFDLIFTPKTPTELKAEGGMREVALSWVGSEEDFIEGYKVFRSTDKAIYKEIAKVEDLGFTDKVSPDTTYYYRVSAIAKEGNESGLSTMAQVTATKLIPKAPGWFSTNPGERSVAITWEPSSEEFVTAYAIYREEAGEFKLITKTEKTNYVDRSVKPETAYAYRITSLSSDGVESDAVTAKVVTLKQTKPPVELVVEKISNVFSNNYKYYEKEPIAGVKVINNTGEHVSKLRVSFMIKEFMDYPTESEIDDLGPFQTVDVPVNALFNNRVLEVTENTPVQASITVSYYDNNSPQSYNLSQPLTLYEKHHVTWDVRERIATFVTPKDPVVLEFARETARQYSDLNPDALIHARAVFDALGVMGLSYMADPSSPYSGGSGSDSSGGSGSSGGRADLADYVQYPRETLLRKSGDCDDLVNLYSSALESLGIETRLLDMPGHILMMFSTGMDKGIIQSSGELADMFVVYEGYAWVPVETTLVGSSFTAAWKKGVSVYNDKKDSGLVVIDPRKAWETYKPASLPPSNWRPEKVWREDIEARFGDDLEYLKSLRIRYQSSRHLDSLYNNPSDTDALLQTGIVYGENESPKAEEFFRKVLDIDPGNTAALNNLGNVYFLQAKYDQAAEFYEQAALGEPGDPNIWVNLARCYLKLGEKVKAKDAFERAYTLDPEVARTYRDIAFQVGDPSLMLRMP